MRPVCNVSGCRGSELFICDERNRFAYMLRRNVHVVAVAVSVGVSCGQVAMVAVATALLSGEARRL